MQTMQEYMKGKESITFRQFLKTLNENPPVAYEGDYEGNKAMLSDISRTVIEKYYKKLNIPDHFKLRSDVVCYIIDDNSKVMIGYFDNDRFNIISELYPIVYSDINKFGYKNVLQTAEVATAKLFRGKGYASAIYLTLINNGYTLVSDYAQFDGARKLWKKLQNYVTLDVYNEITDEIHKNHTIEKTNIDDLDKEWSKDSDFSSVNILFIAHN